MKIQEIKTKVFKQSVNNKDIIKEKLLSWFHKEPVVSLGTNYNISKTDWKKSFDMNRDYVKYLLKEFTPYINNIGEDLKTEKCSIFDMWYQQYNKNDNHEWHNHGVTNWANIYFVELPDETGTEFLDFKVDDIKEGDLLTFPAYYMHRSPINKSNERKPIVSFNSNYTDYKEH